MEQLDTLCNLGTLGAPSPTGDSGPRRRRSRSSLTSATPGRLAAVALSSLDGARRRLIVPAGARKLLFAGGDAWDLALPASLAAVKTTGSFETLFFALFSAWHVYPALRGEKKKKKKFTFVTLLKNRDMLCYVCLLAPVYFRICVEVVSKS